jgi:uncharacterized protein
MRFATDASLGKLGRLLRAAGFDTRCEHQSTEPDFWRCIEPERIVLTRTRRIAKRLMGHPMVFIRPNDPVHQLNQVVAVLAIDRADLRPFTRCLACNTPIRAIDRQQAYGQVPMYVWNCQSTFHTCDSCKRIYWAGSHHERICRRFEVIFKHKDSIIP